MKRVLAALLILTGSAVVSPAVFDPVSLSAEERAELETRALPFGYGSPIASVHASTFFGDSKAAIVEFAENKRTEEYAMQFAVECFSSDAASWDCTDPYRIVTFLHDAIPGIKLRGEVPIPTIRLIIQLIRRREGVHLVSVDAIEAEGIERYRVDVTNYDGFGVHSVQEKDLVAFP